ncbi:MAG: BON domain-containing protein [Synechococcales bacterium]|nr:BON domain-containing protein [Synechococcales bacterium]
MGWLQRIFGGGDKAEAAPQNAPAPEAASGGEIPPERVGLNGEYDQSGLAKRVAQAFDQDPMVADIETVWVAQTSGLVVLKGKVPTSEQLNRLIEIANEQSGATAVNVDQVEVG